MTTALTVRAFYAESIFSWPRHWSGPFRFWPYHIHRSELGLLGL